MARMTWIGAAFALVAASLLVFAQSSAAGSPAKAPQGMAWTVEVGCPPFVTYHAIAEPELVLSDAAYRFQLVGGGRVVTVSKSCCVTYWMD